MKNGWDHVKEDIKNLEMSNEDAQFMHKWEKIKATCQLRFTHNNGH